MPLPNDLISEFVEVTAEHVDVKSEESTVYGTIVVQNDVKYVQLDGSDILTPIDSTTESVDGNRVIVLIKNHTATVTGNLSNNSASVGTTNQIITDLNNTNTIIAENIIATNGKFDNLSAVYATIALLEAKYATIENLKVSNAEIENLKTDKLSAEQAELTYANIDFANIGEAAIRKIFVDTGMIGSAIIDNATITGELVGVTIRGDKIVGNSIIADKLVIRGDDGIYYKLNIDENGVAPEGVSDDDLKNGLHGSRIIAESITAEKISVSDLVAFDATIGGFIIDENAIHSSVKTSADNTTRGVYMDNDGQFVVGDGTNYLKYYKDTDEQYKLAISASSMIFTATGDDDEDINVEDAIDTAKQSSDDLADKVGDMETTVKQLVDSISTLVRGANGESMMTQTDTGWTFNISSIQKELSDAIESIGDLNSDMTETDTLVETLNTAVKDLGEYTEYIKFGTDGGKPCIILGETDSNFKVKITNTDIRFMDGQTVPASVSNQSLKISKAVVSEELTQGGFTWMARPNGNYGLLWRGV